MKELYEKAIKNNIRFKKIQRIVEVLSNKYGPVVAAGGSLVDCIYGLEFYDVDLFICINDLKKEYRKEYKSKSHIMDVIRDHVDGEMIDIIVTDYSVADHIARFDQNFKRISYDLVNGINIADEAIRDLQTNKISLNTMNGSVVYYRILKSSKKYGLMLDDLDTWLLRNFITVMGAYIPVKYEALEKEFIPVDDYDYTMAVLVDWFSHTYWDWKLPCLPKWKMIRTIAKMYMRIFKMNINS